MPAGSLCEWLTTSLRRSRSAKAALRRLAEHGSTTKEIAAVSGHRSLSEIERYTAKADQAGLADSAIGKLPDAENG
jgi:predicted transcriptional regulator